MHLTPRELDRLTIFSAAELARRRRSRGRRLNVPEAIAVICDEVLEAAWDGASLAEVIEHGRSVLGPDDVMDGVRILGRKTVELMTSNHLPGDGDLQLFAMPGGYGEVGFAGMGFGLTVAVAKAPTATQVIGSPGEYMWGGAASTIFWVDPAEDLTMVFMTQLIPSGTFNFRGQLKTLVYPAIAD